MKNIVNGPINTIRLEGNMNGQNKILYLFLDVHSTINEQTQYKNYKGIDITTFLYKEFKNWKNKNEGKYLDFFSETELSGIHQNINNNRQIYIYEVEKLFIKNFNKNRINDQSANNKIRYHYIDIRDVYHETILPIMIQLTEFSKILFDGNIQIYMFDEIIIKINELLKYMNDWIKSLYGNLTESDTLNAINNLNLSDNPILQNFSKYVFKIRNKYNNDHIINNMKDIYAYIKKMFDINLNKITSLLNLIEIIKQIHQKRNELNLITFDDETKYFSYYSCNGDTYENHLCEIRKIIKFIWNNTSQIFGYITDIYFLRRFLDKEYIRNGIIYTGYSHSMLYIYHLIKIYDFKITHFSYSKETNLEKLNDTIKHNVNNISEIYIIEELLLPPLLTQYSDLTNFPDFFL